MELLSRAGRAGRAGSAAALVLAIVAISPSAASGPIELAVPGRSNATPSIAADGDFVTVVWGASASSGATDVYAAISRDAGRTFGSPVRVNDVDGDAQLNGEQPPRVTIHGDAVRAAGHGVPPSITVVWTTKGARGTKLVQSRSSDGGRSFAKATTVPGGDAAGNRGWENAVADRDGRVYTVWLDHRELAQQDDVATTHHNHTAGAAPRVDGVAMAQRSKLFFASLDGAMAPRAVTGGVCYCCKTALAAGSGGSVFAAWRHVYPGNIRDIAFTGSRDGGRTFAAPIRVSEDKWVLQGCPDDGPAMAIDATNRIHIVWPTLVTGAAAETIALFYATSADGLRFTPRERIPTEGLPHHPQIAIERTGSLAIAWDESANGTRRAAMARMTLDAAAHPRFARTIIGDRAVYPAIAAASDATLLAWTEGVAPAAAIRVVRVP
jgi:hypothetical protein